MRVRGIDDAGALEGGAAVAGLSKGESVNTEAFSYLFRAASRFPGDISFF